MCGEAIEGGQRVRRKPDGKRGRASADVHAPAPPDRVRRMGEGARRRSAEVASVGDRVPRTSRDGRAREARIELKSAEGRDRTQGVPRSTPNKVEVAETRGRLAPASPRRPRRAGTSSYTLRLPVDLHAAIRMRKAVTGEDMGDIMVGILREAMSEELDVVRRLTRS